MLIALARKRGTSTAQERNRNCQGKQSFDDHVHENIPQRTVKRVRRSTIDWSVTLDINTAGPLMGASARRLGVSGWFQPAPPVFVADQYRRRHNVLAQFGGRVCIAHTGGRLRVMRVVLFGVGGTAAHKDAGQYCSQSSLADRVHDVFPLAMEG
jgi:hypothetical protein